MGRALARQGVGVLPYFGIQRVRLMTNNLSKTRALADARRSALHPAHQQPSNHRHRRYLEAKALKCGHPGTIGCGL